MMKKRELDESLIPSFFVTLKIRKEIEMEAQDILLQKILGNNPQVARILNEIKESGKSPKDLFYEKAKQMGVNPDDIIKTLQSINK